MWTTSDRMSAGRFRVPARDERVGRFTPRGRPRPARPASPTALPKASQVGGILRSMMTTLAQEDRDGVRVLRPAGNLNHEGTEPIEPAFASATPPGARVVVDLSGVDLITTPGITLLVSAAHRVKQAEGKLAVTGVRDFVADLFQRCRLDAVLATYEDVDKAVAAVRA